MRKITKEAIQSFLNGNDYNKSNTRVSHTPYTDNNTNLYLHNNLIARKTKTNWIEISNAGWTSDTTKERLNGLPWVSIQQKNFEWYLNGEKWDWNWIKI